MAGLRLCNNGASLITGSGFGEVSGILGFNRSTLHDWVVKGLGHLNLPGDRRK